MFCPVLIQSQRLDQTRFGKWVVISYNDRCWILTR